MMYRKITTVFMLLLVTSAHASVLTIDFQDQIDDLGSGGNPAGHDVGVGPSGNVFWLPTTGVAAEKQGRNQPNLQIGGNEQVWDGNFSTRDLLSDWLANRSTVDYNFSVDLEELAGEAGTLGLDLNDDSVVDSNLIQGLSNGDFTVSFIFGGGANATVIKDVRFVQSGSAIYSGYDNGTLGDDPRFIATGEFDWGAFLDSRTDVAGEADPAQALADKLQNLRITIDISVGDDQVESAFVAVDNVVLKAVAEPIPEPASLVLMGFGSVLLMSRSKR